ncbi:MAG: hypothetical protein JXR37_19785 [Kiritimatiellae bacterium]|nr:hypothetical protein [Kiritimatiellia bacterium]
MRRRARLTARPVLGLLALAAIPCGGEAAEPAHYRSPFDLAFSPDGALVAVSDRTGGCLTVVDARAHRVLGHVALNGKPSGVAWTGLGEVLVAEYDAGSIAVVDAASRQVVRRLRIGPKPIGLAVAAKAGLLVVAESGLNAVSILDLATGKPRARIPVPRQPYFVAVSRDETVAVVGNLLPAGPATDVRSASAVSLIDLAKREKAIDIPLPPGSSCVRRIAVSPDGKWAYAVHTLGRVALPTTQLERGWVNSNAMTVIDLAARAWYATVLLDKVAEGAADPWGIALSAGGNTAFITLAGAHQIASIDLARLHSLMAGRPPGTGEPGAGGKDKRPAKTFRGAAAVWAAIQEDPAQRARLMNDLGALYAVDLLLRIPVPTQCPRGIGLAPDGSALAIAGYYSGEVLFLDPATCRPVARCTLGPQPEADPARLGEIVFHDATRCFQKWLSCATCHPDGRADGLNWDLLNDGIGNPKNTRSLLWSHKTPPVMARGVRPSYDVAVQKGFQFIQFFQPQSNETELVNAYIRSMEPEPSPYLRPDGRLSARAEKGKALFENPKVGCAQCHPAPLYTDLKLYDVGTRHALDRDGTFDNPILIELWRTGPFLHDGSAAAMKDVLRDFNRENRHGVTSHLSEQELEALAEYLLSL